MSKESDPWVRTFSVTDPIRHKKGHTLYKVTSKVFPKNSFESVTEVTVWKRYNDFKKLHKALFTIHQSLYLKDTFPAFAKAKFFGRFDDDVIEERRQSALQLLEFAAKHPPLFTSQIFVKFFEGGQMTNFPKEDNTVANILQPIKSEKNYLSQSNGAKPSNSLGGIWQHHQAADEISLTSRTSETDDEEDDQTTFTTDDDPSVSTLDLSEFDPLAFKQVLGSENDLRLGQKELCDSWLLSALQSCAQNDAERTGLDSNLVFPRPFLGLDDNEISVPETSKKMNVESSALFPVSNEIIVNNSVVDMTLQPNVSEFDPLSTTLNKSQPEQGKAVSVSDVFNIPNAKSVTLKQNCDCSYIFNAAKFISAAQNAELSKKFLSAFGSYKTAISILLQGVQRDPCPEQREAVRRKVDQYLMRAEEIYKYHVSKMQDCNQKLKDTVLLNSGISSSLYRSTVNLAKFRVIGILHKVLLVLDTAANKTCVIKTLYKSSSLKLQDMPSILPLDIPFMVQLYEIYETCYAIFLVLEYAGGGRVWDYVTSYFHRSPVSPNNEYQHLYYQIDNSTDFANVYSGKITVDDNLKITSVDNVKQQDEQLAMHNSLNCSADSDLTASKNCPSSYVSLFRNYIASTNKGNTVSFAKCDIDLSSCKDDENADEFYTFDDFSSETFVQEKEDTLSNVQNIFLSETNLNTDVKLLNSDNLSVNNATISENDCNNSEEFSSLLPSKPDGFDAIISNSKTLLQEVDNTLNSVQDVIPVNSNNRNIKNHKIMSNVNRLSFAPSNVSADRNKDYACKNIVTSQCNDEKIINTSITCRPKNLSNEAVVSCPRPCEKTIIGNSENFDAHIFSSQINETRSRLSSSTGDLSAVFLQKSCVTEMFHKMDAILSSSKPVHLPESCIYLWAAEIVIAVDSLHKLGIIWQDLQPDNIVLGSEGHILLTYQSQWNCVDHILDESAKANLYSAPEVGNVFPVTPSCDWWSVGAILYELLTGRKLVSCHPSGITSHTNIYIPDDISKEAGDFLKKLLQYNALQRLGSGSHGIENIKCHPFFQSVKWDLLDNTKQH